MRAGCPAAEEFLTGEQIPNPKVYRVCHDITLRVTPGTSDQPNLTIANHSTLLMNKRFSH